jgi:hypothetical protein
MTQRWLSGIAVAWLAACGEAGAAGPDPAECEAVLTHLVVLEGAKDGSDGPLCKYHPRCGNAPEEAEKFVKQCPRVLSRVEAGCYLRATSLTEVDACLIRSELDDRIQRGKRGPAAAELEAPAWLGEGGGTLGDRVLRRVEGHARQACGCRDAACARQVRDRFTAWAASIDEEDPEIAPRQRDIEAAVEQMFECVRDIERFDPPDAAVAGPATLYGPDAGGYNPYGGSSLGPYIGIWECDTYRDSLEVLLKCSSMPTYMQDELTSGYRSFKASLGDPTTMSYSARQATAEQCVSMQQSLRSTASTMGCPL